MDTDKNSARKEALGFERGFGRTIGPSPLVERVDALLENFTVVSKVAVNIPKAVRTGQTLDPVDDVRADYTKYRKLHFSKRKCPPECPFCKRAKKNAR